MEFGQIVLRTPMVWPVTCLMDEGTGTERVRVTETERKIWRENFLLKNFSQGRTAWLCPIMSRESGGHPKNLYSQEGSPTSRIKTCLSMGSTRADRPVLICAKPWATVQTLNFLSFTFSTKFANLGVFFSRNNGQCISLMFNSSKALPLLCSCWECAHNMRDICNL